MNEIMTVIIIYLEKGLLNTSKIFCLALVDDCISKLANGYIKVVLVLEKPAL